MFQTTIFRIFLDFIEFFTKDCFAKDFMVLGVSLKKVSTKLLSPRS